MYYVGIDWADQKHDGMILDHTGRVIFGPWSIKKNHAGFEQMADHLRNLSQDPEEFKIGLETPHNLLVEFLVDLDYPVYALFPGSMKSFRKRYRPSGARDDAFDAFVLADVLRTDSACWRKVDFGSDIIRETRLLVRDHHHLGHLQIDLSNSLRATLKSYYPEYIHFFSNVACPSSLAFLVAYPDLDSARKLSPQALRDFFKEHNLHNNRLINQIYTRLQQSPLRVAPTVVRAKTLKAMASAKQLIVLAHQIKPYTQRLEALVQKHPDGEIFLSYPGVSYVMAARLMALFGDNRERYLHVNELQALAGTCPVTEQSGKRFRVVYYRTACNKFYRDIMHNLAFSSLKAAPWAMAYYKHHRTLGKNHNHTLRCLGNLHLRILFAMWKHRELYDENIFLAQRARHWMQK
jgi:transposase